MSPSILHPCLLIGMLFASFYSLAQEVAPSTTSAEELAKKLSNPVSNLISVPLQNNVDYGMGAFNGTRNTLNFQPVVPFALTPRWNLIGRVILPLITQYNITGEGSSQSGLGDAVVSGFFSPTGSKQGFTWGAGPVLLVPVATQDLLGSKKLGIGPTAVALKQMGGWTFGGLANQIWSVAGNAERAKVNQLFLQPFLAYNFKSGAGLSVNSEMTFNWEGNSSTIFLNPVVSAVTKMGSQTTQLALGPRIPLAAPDNGRADWGWRAVLVFLFPQ